MNLSDIVNNIGGFAIVGEGGEDLSGYSVGAAGDVNGDGLADLIVGAPGYDAAHGDVQTGRSYIILGAKTGAFKAGSFVDDIGTSGNDTVASTGSQTLAGGTGVVQAMTPSHPTGPMYCWAAKAPIFSF